MTAPVLAADSDSFLWWDWVDDHYDEIWDRTIEHLQLTGVALAIGFGVSVALSVLALRWRPTYGPITWATGLLTPNR